jgi:hypothetical protein
MRPNVRIETLARRGKNVERQLLENALANSQSVSDFAMDPSNFGSGRAGAFGAIAQGLTAGVGAFAQYKNQQKLAQLNSEDADAFAQFATEKGNPELANVASRLSPESREAYYLSMALPQSQNSNIPSAIREFEYYKTLPTEQQSQYLGVKRNIAGEGAIVRSTGAIETLGGYGEAGAQKTGMEQTAKNVSDLNYKPSIAGESAFAQGKAEEDVKAQEKLIDVQAQSDNILNVIKAFKTHPGVPDLFGAKGGGAILSYLGKKDPIAGSNAAGAKALLEQFQGQQLLQAFNTLKGSGTGAVSNEEGKAFVNAHSAIREGISEKELFKNLQIMEGVIQKVIERQTKRAGEGYQRGSVQINNQNVDPNQMGLDLTTMMGNQRSPQQKPASNIKFLGFE